MVRPCSAVASSMVLPVNGGHRLHRQADVLAAGLQLAHDVAQRVGAVALDDVDRVDAVAGRLAHHLALAVQDVGVDEAVLERQVAQVVHAGDDHARHPQGDDVAAGHQAGAGVVVAQAVLAAAGGAERGAGRGRPERCRGRASPGCCAATGRWRTRCRARPGPARSRARPAPRRARARRPRRAGRRRSPPRRRRPRRPARWRPPRRR